MALIRERTSIFVKLETVAGTDAAPTAAANALEVYSPSITFNRSVSARKPLGAGLSPNRTLLNRSYGGLTFSAELKGAGAAGSAPDWGPALEACGYGKNVSAGVKVSYKPVSTGQKSLTAWIFQDGLLTKLTGCRGNARFMVGLDALSLIEFNFMGLLAEGQPIAAPYPASIHVDATVPVAAKECSFTFSGAAMDIATFELDTGNSVELPGSLSSSTGYLPAVITNRNPAGTFDPLQTTGNDNLQVLMDANADHALAWSNGGAAGNIIQIKCPKATLTEVGEGDRAGGVLTYPASFVPARTAGDDEIEIIVQ